MYFLRQKFINRNMHHNMGMPAQTETRIKITDKSDSSVVAVVVVVVVVVFAMAKDAPDG